MLRKLWHAIVRFALQDTDWFAVFFSGAKQEDIIRLRIALPVEGVKLVSGKARTT
jgi:hypothetical protein